MAATSTYLGPTVGSAIATPGGSPDEIQYNNSGALGGFGSWDGSLLTVPGSVSLNSSGLFEIPLGVPQNVVATPGTSGSLAAGTYYFKVTAVATADSTGETTGSVEVSAVIAPGDDGTGSIDLTWDEVTARDQFRVYVGTAPEAEDSVGDSVTGDPAFTLTDMALLSPGTVPTTNTAFALTASTEGIAGSGTTIMRSGGGGQNVGFLILSGNSDIDAGYAVVVSEDNNFYPAGLHPYNGASMELGFSFNNGGWNSLWLQSTNLDSSGNIITKSGEDSQGGSSGSDATNLSFVGGNGGAGDGMGNVSGNGANVSITAGVAGATSGGATAGTDGFIALNSPAVLANGLALRGDTTDAHTWGLDVYDVNGTAFRRFMTATNGDAPDVTFAPPTTGTLVMQATTYKSSDGSSGVTAGPFTAITGITVKNGLVTALTGT